MIEIHSNEQLTVLANTMRAAGISKLTSGSLTVEVDTTEYNYIPVLRDRAVTKVRTPAKRKATRKPAVKLAAKKGASK